MTSVFLMLDPRKYTYWSRLECSRISTFFLWWWSWWYHDCVVRWFSAEWQYFWMFLESAWNVSLYIVFILYNIYIRSLCDFILYLYNNTFNSGSCTILFYIHNIIHDRFLSVFPNNINVICNYNWRTLVFTSCCNYVNVHTHTSSQVVV